jgi:predicted branched-subunit amino acid permease
MSTALTQKLAPGIRTAHRFGLAYCITDEIFGLSIGFAGYLVPYYTYGITVISVAGWSTGTFLGIVAGNILPAWLVNALGVSLYGMFLAIIIPPAKKEKGVLAAVLISAVLSIVFEFMLKSVSGGFAIIICSVIAAAICAVLFPVPEEEEGEA